MHIYHLTRNIGERIILFGSLSNFRVLAVIILAHGKPRLLGRLSEFRSFLLKYRYIAMITRATGMHSIGITSLYCDV